MLFVGCCVGCAWCLSGDRVRIVFGDCWCFVVYGVVELVMCVGIERVCSVFSELSVHMVCRWQVHVFV